MKKFLGVMIIALLGLSAPSFAQSTVDKAKNGVETGAKKAWHGTKKGAKAVGNKTAEVTKKGVARVTDKKSDEYVGPSGQTIYIDDLNKYYYVDNKGKKVYLTQGELKAKSKQ